MNNEGKTNTIELAAQLTIAWLSNQSNRVSTEDVPIFLRTIYATLNSLGEAAVASIETETANGQDAFAPAVSVRKSLSSRDHIISMIDGKPYRTLRRHLAAHGLTPDEYRTRYNLKPDYPMVAESYSEKRRALAREIGLGQRGRAAKARAAAANGTPSPRRRGPRPA